MEHRHLTIPVALVVLCACGALTAHVVNARPVSTGSESALREIGVEFDRFLHDADPLRASQEGDRDALRRLPDVSRATERVRRGVLAQLSERLIQVDATRMSEAAALDHALLTYLIKQRIEEIDLDLSRIAFQSSDGFHTVPMYLARSTVISSVDQAEAWLERLEALPTYYEQNIANLRRGVDTHYTQPRIVVARVLEVARQQAALPTEQSPLLAPFAQLPDSIPSQVQRDLRERALGLIRGRVIPAQQQFLDFLVREYVPAARPALAWRSMPNGEAIYRYRVRRETTSDMTPEQVHQLGLDEVSRIRAQMEATIRDSGFSGSLAEFLHMLRTDRRFYASSSEQLIERASEIAKRIDGELPRLFATLPRLPFTIKPFPAEVAEGAPTGQYMAGSVALGRPGTYMLNTAHLDQRPLYEIPALTLHEAAPGHHLQIALSQELRELPYYRRNMGLTAFVEGWGLYAESLGEEMGIYRDPYERFGRYSYEMWRACRLVADTGIHWLGWDIEQARRCFTENTALAPHNIQTELERYIAWPAQALSYKVGEGKLRELRQSARRELGERFDIRAFHEQVLSGGALPLSILEARIREWIREQAASQQCGGSIVCSLRLLL
jgi:uncharacterized protein (DUF885 family)